VSGRAPLFGRALFVAGIGAVLLCQGACADSATAGDAAAAVGDRTAHGTFLLSLVAPKGTTPGFTAMLGKAYEGPYPSAVVWEDKTGAGVCRLWIPRIPVCDPACKTGPEVCAEDDVCTPYPEPMSVGTIDAAGLAKPFSMTPVMATYQIVGVQLPYPAFSRGDDLTFAASGDASAAPFTMRGEGIDPLVVSSGDILVDGSPAKLTWEAPEAPAQSEVRVVFDVSYHGGTKGKVQCDCPDTGSVVVPGGLLTALVDLGTSGFPKVEITRVAVGTTEPDFPVTLIVQAKVTRLLSIPGVVSCMGHSDCPAGRTCGLDFKCV